MTSTFVEQLGFNEDEFTEPEARIEWVFVCIFDAFLFILFNIIVFSFYLHLFVSVSSSPVFYLHAFIVSRLIACCEVTIGECRFFHQAVWLETLYSSVWYIGHALSYNCNFNVGA